MRWRWWGWRLFCGGGGGVAWSEALDLGRLVYESGENFDLHSDNDNPWGIWSDGTTMWVVDDDNEEKIFAYKMSDKMRDTAKDFNSLEGADNEHVKGIWANATTMYVADSLDDHIYAYNTSNRLVDNTKDFALDDVNDAPRGIWSDGTTMWVADDNDHKLYAYTLPGGTYDSSKDITLHDDNDDPTGVWSDGHTIWVADHDDDKLYAYVLALTDGVTFGFIPAHNASRDLALDSDNDDPKGLWSDGTTMWVADGDDNIYAYAPPRRITLALNEDAVAEGAGGAPSVTASLDRAFSDGTEVSIALAVSVPSPLTATFVPMAPLTTATLTIAAGDTDSTGVVLVNVTAAHDEVFTGNRFALVSGTATFTGSGTASAPRSVRFVLVDDETAPVGGAVYDTSVDFDLDAAGNNSPVDLWSDGTTMWVVNSDYTDTHDKLFAYTVSTKAHVSTKDIDLDDKNAYPTGVWSDGTTVWVGDQYGRKLFAYELSTGDRSADEDIDLLLGGGADDVQFPRGMWSDGTTMWIVDRRDDKLLAYTLSTGGRDAGKDVVLDSHNGLAQSVWSDGTTMWVSDLGDEKLYAYTLSGGSYDPSKDVDLHSDNSLPNGVWSDGERLWVADSDGTIYGYRSRPRVTLELSQSEVSEDGGAATVDVTASLDRGSTEATTVTVSFADPSSVGATLSSNTTLTIAAGRTLSTGTVRVFVPDVDDAVFTGNRFVAVSGTANNSVGVKDPADVRLVVLEDETVALEGWDRESALDFTGLTTVMNEDPRGIWSDGETVWVADNSDGKLYAYMIDPGGANHGDRDMAKEFDLADSNANTATEDNGDPQGIWSDGETIWVADSADNKLYAYRMDPGESGHGERERSKEFGLHANNGDAQGIWSDGITVWVADAGADKLFAYKMDPGGSGHGNRDMTKEFDLADSNTGTEDNGDARGIWSDGTTIWVADVGDAKPYAYTLSSRSRDRSKELVLDGDNGAPVGLWSDGTYLWVADTVADELFGYGAVAKPSFNRTQYVISEDGGFIVVCLVFEEATGVPQAVTYTLSAVPDDGLTPDGTTIAFAVGDLVQCLEISIHDNNVFTGDRTVTISATAGDILGFRNPADARLVITDDEEGPEVTLSVTPTSISENGGTAMVTASLNTAVTAATTVTVSLTGTAATLTGSSLTIPANMTASTGTGLTLTGVDDSVYLGARTVTVTGTATSSASAIGNPPGVEVTVTDDETRPVVTLTVDPASISENGGTAEVTATLNRVSTAATTVTVSLSDTSVATLSDTSLTIPANMLNSDGSLTVTGVDDSTYTGTRTVTVTGMATNTLETVGDIADVSLTVTDDESPPRRTTGGGGTPPPQEETQPEAPPPAGFADVDAQGVHAADIDAIYRAGITTGCGTEPLRFCPGEPVTRAQMASFLSRALDLETAP